MRGPALALTLLASLVPAAPAAGTSRAFTAADAAPESARAPVAQLRSVERRSSFGARFVRYRQLVGGLPVLGADAVLTDGRGSHGDLLLDSTRRLSQAPPPATVGRGEAIDTAVRRLGVDELRGAPRASQAVLPRAQGARTVWQVRVSSARPSGSWEALVDARSSEVLRVRDLALRAYGQTGTARVFDTNPVTFYGTRAPGGAALADFQDADSPELDAALEQVPLQRLTDANLCLEGRWVWARYSDTPGEGSGWFNDLCAADESRDFTGVTRAQPGFEALMSYYHVDRAQSHVQSLGFANVFNRQIEVYANWILSNGMSYYVPQDEDIVLTFAWVDDAEDAEVVLHEYGHALQNDQVFEFGLDGGQAGAVGEGFADYWAATITRTFVEPARPELDACLAEWETVGQDDANPRNPYVDPPCLRRMDRDLTPADVGLGTPCGGEVHCAGEAWSGALWDIRGRLGGAVTDRLVLQSHFSLTQDASYHDAALAIVAADRALHGGVHVPFLHEVLARQGLDDAPDGATPLALPATSTDELRANVPMDPRPDPDPRDLYAVALTAGEEVVLRLAGDGADLDLRLLRPGSTDLGDPQAVVAAGEQPGSNEQIRFVPGESGTYLVDVLASAGFGAYRLSASLDRDRDGLPDSEDNCPTVQNPEQSDGDRDGVGDLCEPPASVRDGCAAMPNRGAADWDGDGRSDACDRSSKVTLKRRRAGRKIVLRATLRPATLGGDALSLDVRRHGCRRGCRFRPLRVRPRLKPAGAGTVDAVLRLRRPGLYRVQALLESPGLNRARSRPLRLRIARPAG